jgi:hypothetical protein
MNALRHDLPELPARMRNLPVNDDGFPVPATRTGIEVKHRCPLCGEPLGQYTAFVIDSITAVTRTATEAPAHIECARFAAATLSRAFVALVWVTRSYSLDQLEDKPVFRIGYPEQTFWYAGGRSANRQEVMDAMQAALPTMYEIAHRTGEAAVMELDMKVARATKHFPKHAAFADHA